MEPGEHQNEFERRLADAWPARHWANSHVVIGVSGGPDSVAMLCALVALKTSAGGAGKLYAAHLNHQKRGAQAEEDQDWVRRLCDRLGVPLLTERADVAAIADAHGDGWEAAARCARYDFFQRAAKKTGARFVTVGHTADDQVETVLHRIIRGTGMEGLAGIPRVRPLSECVVLVRPLLSLHRADVLGYLASIDQDFRIDRSNEDVQFTRNRIRRELLPRLREGYNERVDDALLRLASQAADMQSLIAAIVNRLADECVQASNREVRICWRQLSTEHPALMREVCRVAWTRAGWPEQAMGFEQWSLLASSLQEGFSGSFTLPGNIQVIRDGNLLLVKAIASAAGVP